MAFSDFPGLTSSVRSEYRVSGATLWTANGEYPSVNIEVRHGIVQAIHPFKTETARPGDIDGRGLVILPAGVDAQVHLRVPGQPQKETAESGIAAAIHGGVGTFLAMPNTKPVIDCLSALELGKQEAAPLTKETGVEVLWSAALTKQQKGQEIVDFDALFNAGITAFTDDGVGVARDDIMAQCLDASVRLGFPILQHAEIPGHGAVLAAGPMQVASKSPVYEAAMEADMVERDLALCLSRRGAKYHVLHVSSRKTLELVKRAKAEGLAVTCEVSPHHLYFSSEEIPADNTSFKMNPPLRSPEDRSALLDGLRTGLVDFMATDHAPHESDVKTTNFKTSAFGTVGIETSLRVLLALWQQGVLTSKRLVEVWATEPARFLNVSDTYGDIKVGKKFNAVLIDAYAAPQAITTEYHWGKSKNSCFIGSQLPGRVVATILGQHVHLINS